MPPLPLLSILVAPDHSQWLLSPQCTPIPALDEMVPSDIRTVLVWMTTRPHEPWLPVMRLSPLISASALLATSTPELPLLLITFSVPGVTPSPPFRIRWPVRTA